MASKQQINTTLSSGGFVQNRGLYNSQGQPVANANGNPSADLTPAQLGAFCITPRKGKFQIETNETY